MPTFRYKAYNSGGETIAGSINAPGIKDAIQAVKNTGLYPVDVKEDEGPGGGYFRKKVASRDLALSTRQLATLISTGTNLSEALTVLSENTGNPRLRSVLMKVKEAVLEGSSFARALEPHSEVFTPFYRGLVASAEASGSLDKVLPRLADYLETRARISSEVKTALTYPALMSFVGFGVLAFLLIFVVPKIAHMFEETQAELPLVTVFLLWVTGIFRSYWPVLAAVSAGAAWYLRRASRTGPGKALFERLTLKLPWFGKAVSAFLVANFTRTLGSLLKGGVQMLKALEITKDVLNHSVYNGVLEAAVRDCTGGSSLSASLRKDKTLPPIVIHMISVGERSGNLDEMLLKTADAYDLEFENGVKKALSLLEPALILLMGLAVGFIVLAILLPIFELNQVIR